MKKCKSCKYINQNSEITCSKCGANLDSNSSLDALGVILFIISLHPILGIILIILVRDEKYRKYCAKGAVFSVTMIGIIVILGLFYYLFLMEDNKLLFEDNCSSYGENVIYKEIDGKDYCYDPVTEEVYPYEEKI